MNRIDVAGFTLIEVLVALVIVSVAVLSLGSFTVSTMTSGQESRERLTAVHLAEQVLESWQQSTKDYAPVIGNDCLATLNNTVLPTYPFSVTCTPASGIAISYTMNVSRASVTGPLPANLSTFQTFTKQGYYALTPLAQPQSKLVTVTWSHKAISHSIHLTHLSMVK
ncbi:MAG: prepilin-type N-terminal cleavage/methylation domain-containing protein [Mariprofundus sp.]|nr:prepilin-type N-terminal cleavage/methylation domain-containing protein [Mariprofundus sp.]